MRVLIVKVPHEGNDRYTWMVAYMLPFTVVGACNYGSQGDVVTLHLVHACTMREEKAQEIFVNHVQKIANDMHKNVVIIYRRPEEIVACGAPGMTLSWITDHVNPKEH